MRRLDILLNNIFVLRLALSIVLHITEEKLRKIMT